MRKKTRRKIKIYAVDVAMIFLAFQITSVCKGGENSNRYIAQEKNTQYVKSYEEDSSTEKQNEFKADSVSRDWDADETEMLLRIAMAEAEGEGVEGKAHVMGVVLNRVWSKEFPNTIKEVIFQEGQFTPVKDGGRYWTVTPDRECYEAHEMVMRGWDETRGALYFCTSGGSSWVEKNAEYLYTIGNHNFYK